MPRMQPSMLLTPRAFAAGGIVNAGRYIKGPGDGMSDSVPAVIDGKEPAAIGTGEFVVPADVVSALGNGDNDAGAQVLQQMIDRVRHAKTGRVQQPPAIDPNQMMPG